MRLIPKLRFLVGLVIFVLIAGFLFFPHLLFLIGGRLLGRDRTAHRASVNEAISFWVSAAFDLIAPVLKIEVEIRWPKNLRMLTPDQPLIVVLNHQNSFEALPHLWALRRIGRTNVRLVMKNELLWAPAVGLACYEGGSAFVGRDGHRKDKLAIEDSARIARADGATFVLYAEGTRSNGNEPGPGLRRLLKPKTGGFKVLCREMEAPVLAMATIFVGADACKTMFDVDALVGCLIVIDMTLSPPVHHEQASEWLHDEWRRMDQVVSDVQ
ncbi:MAG: lysophospholipid acyltransferase family protein [Patescibacteria group bacterium]